MNKDNSEIPIALDDEGHKQIKTNCELCDGEYLSLRTEIKNGVDSFFYHCQHCGSEYVDHHLVKINKTLYINFTKSTI
jgi:uncharacterized Zn finger protein